MQITIAENTLADIVGTFAKEDPQKIKIGYLLGERSEAGITVNGVILPPQTANFMLTEISLIDEMNTLKTYKDHVVGFIQYNGSYGLFETKESKHSCLRMQEAGFPNMSVVLNAGGDYFVNDRIDPSKEGKFELYEGKVLDLVERAKSD